MVRLLDALQAAGLVERKEEEDRRAKTITLTTRGLTIIDAVADSMQLTGNEGRATMVLAQEEFRHLTAARDIVAGHRMDL